MRYAVLPVNPEEPLDQGDILRQIVVIKNPVGEEGQPVETMLANVVVLSQGCEIDKAIKRKSYVLVACVFRLDALPQGDQGNVRKNKVLSLFHLPQEDPMPIEGYIDWRTIQPVSIGVLVRARASEQYLCTLQEALLDPARERFWDSFFRPVPFGRNKKNVQENAGNLPAKGRRQTFRQWLTRGK